MPCHAMPCSDHAVLLKTTAQHVRISTAMLCRGIEKNGVVRARHGLGMASVNQTRPQCVNQMGKTHSKPLSARHDRGTAWARHAMCESALSGSVSVHSTSTIMYIKSAFLHIHSFVSSYVAVSSQWWSNRNIYVAPL